MEKITFPVVLLISFPEAMLVGLLGLSLLGFKPSVKQILLIGFFQAVIGGLIRSLPLPFGVHTVLQLISFSFVIYLVMLIPYKISFLTALAGLSAYVSVEAVSAPLLLHLTGIPLSEVLNNIHLRVAFFVPEAVVLIVAIMLVRRFKTRLANYFNFVKNLGIETATGQSFEINKSFPLICLFLAQNFLIALFYGVNYAGINAGPVYNILTSNLFPAILIIAVLPVAAVIMIKRVVDLIRTEIETRTQLDALNHVQELLHTIRAQRHNFSHHLQAIYGLLEVEAFQQAQVYIRGNMSEISATSELVKTDNLGITALLQTKTGLAEARKVNLMIDVKTSLKELPIETKDANVILGNLIDNALEAVDGMPPEQRNVEVILSQDLDGYVFEVRNYGRPIEPEIVDKIFNPDFSTKAVGRGMGLYSVDHLIKKYNGKIEVNSNSECTCFKVYIPQK